MNPGASRPLRPLLLAVVLLAGCAHPPTEPAAPHSGVRGMTVQGPSCPGPAVAGSPCPARPVSVELVITNAATGAVVTTVRSGSDGGFAADLPPGDYILTPQASRSSPFPRGQPVRITVTDDRYTVVTVRLDSGIR